MSIKLLELDGAELLRFVNSRAFVKFLQGCYGSGKTTACVGDIIKTSLTQAPHYDNVRYTRHIWVRSTKPELETTTCKTYEVWVPPADFGPIKKRPPMNHTFNYDCGDGTLAHIENYFLALDDPEDIEKLNSLEATTIFFNELREIPKQIVDAATGRVGRYPGKKLSGGKGTTYKHVLGDTNPPPEHHWFTIMSGQVPPPQWMSEEEALSLIKPANWEIILQPPALLEQKDEANRVVGYVPNPLAENIKHLDGGFQYYLDMVGGKTRTWIDIYVRGKPGSEKKGRLVQDQYNPETHRSKTPLPIYPGNPVYVGCDFGLTPAALFGQRPQKQMLIQREIVFRKGDAKELAQEILRMLMRDYPGCDRVHVVGDPSGNTQAQTDSNTPFAIMRAAGVKIIAAPTNDLTIRIDTLNDVFKSMTNGEPDILIDPSCQTFHYGLAVEYQFPEIRGLDRIDYGPVPNKGFSSHVVEAGQYLILGAGGYTRLLKPKHAATPQHQINIAPRSNLYVRRARRLRRR